MMLEHAAEWATFDSREPVPAALIDTDTRRQLTRAIARAFWATVWPSIKDDRLRVSVWFLRPSVKVVALRPFFELVFGEAPPDA